MEAQILMTHEDQTFSLETATLAEVGPNDIAIRTVCSGVSIGTEFSMIRGKLSRGAYPLCTGYQSTGIVEEVGSAVSHLKVGDRVFVRGNKSLMLKDGTIVSSLSGSHASHIVCDASPDSLEGPGLVPEGVDMGTAAMYVMPAVALHGIDTAQPTALETVAVYGVGQIGIGVVALAALRGCRVIALDVNENALKLAKSMGAEHVINVSQVGWEDQFEALAPGGADTVFEATGIPACVDIALKLARSNPPSMIEGQAKFIYQGHYGDAPLAYNFSTAHGKNLRCFYPCHDGQLPNRKRIMHLLAIGALQWEKTITHRLSHTESPKVFDLIHKGDQELIGIVFDWSEA
ncbi:zinc-binding alcohol dehydrogenase [Chloroflexi bacterium TSY]|nr:zinc-binding alcohol dehydrogenase [Chloroflexi bacterium TSY]